MSTTTPQTTDEPVLEKTRWRIDPARSRVEFCTPTFRGLMTVKGRFERYDGTLDLRREPAIELTIDAASLSTKNNMRDKHLRSGDFFDVAKYPTATFKGTAIKFDGDTPVGVDGQFTLKGVTKPLNLKIESFKCIQHPVLKREVCGVEATGEFSRADYGMDFGTKYGFSMKTVLHIQTEGIKQ